MPRRKMKGVKTLKLNAIKLQKYASITRNVEQTNIAAELANNLSIDETFNASPDLEELSNQRDKELVASLVEFCLNDCCNKRSLSMLIYKFAKYRKKLFFFIYPVN